MVHQAERRDVELLTFNAFVPAYDFSETAAAVQGVRIDNDYRAWYDLLRRVEHMFNLGLDLTDLEEQSDVLTESMHHKIEELQEKLPHVDVQKYMESVAQEFVERPFLPLGEMWERELRDLLDDMDE
jgi:hypothetical protein